MISDAKPSWQLALAQLAMPDPTRRFSTTSQGGKKVHYLQVRVNTKLGSEVGDFNPK